MHQKPWVAGLSALLGLAALAALAVLQSGCPGEGGMPQCECELDEECGGSRYCRGCVCLGPCEDSEDCPLDFPNCDSRTQTCEAPCPGFACPPDLPNCGEDGLCEGPCTSADDCPEAAPNCGPDGICREPCESAGDCPDPDAPNCDGSTGLCFGPCRSNLDCIDEDFPNCDPESGLCRGRCPDTACPEGMINCTTDGECFGPCTAHIQCIDPDMPNCDLDPGSPTVGVCLEPCLSGDDCESPLFPNCDPSPGTCQPPCEDNEDCPEETPRCETSTGLCFLPGCVDDAGCSPPETVCEDFSCVPGCEGHEDCAAAERCDLVDEGHLNHCEPRDCLSDADCTAAGQVCDTDGLADPRGGGYCTAGCATAYDCGQDGYDCDAGTGRCSPHDYGDIGADCAGGCHSGFCLADAGNLCTGFCCRQEDCPVGWGCWPVDDGSGEERMVDACVPLEPTAGTRRVGEICLDGTDCRSGVCTDTRCAETCCTDADCAPFADTYCAVSYTNGQTGCAPLPATGNNPLGTPGCSTSGSPGDCRSNLCFTFYISDTGCTGDAECPARRPTCFDLYGDGNNDCARDFCVEHCCSERDCPDFGTDLFACSPWTFGTGDHSVCLLYEGTAPLGEGEACATNGDCRSNVCSQTDGVCRGRCCTDEDCTLAGFGRCGLELDRVYGIERLMNVCLP